MCINLTTSSIPALNLISAGSAVLGGALAGSMIGPIGAAGGAFFGAASHMGRVCAERTFTKIFDLDSAEASLVDRVISFVVTFFAAVGAGMLALSLSGLEISFDAAALLSGASFIIPSAIILTIIGGIGFFYMPRNIDWDDL